MIANGVLGAVSSGLETYYDDQEDKTLWDYVMSVSIGGAIGVLGGRIGSNGTGSKHLTRSASNFFEKSWTAAKGVFKNGLKKTGVAIGKAGKYYYSQIAKESINCGIKAICPILASNMPNATYKLLDSASRRGN